MGKTAFSYRKPSSWEVGEAAFSPPSSGRREYPREPLPLEGAAERSEAGLASFFGGEAASSLPSPSGEGFVRRCYDFM